MSERKQIISFRGQQYQNYGERIPKQGDLPKDQRIAIIENAIKSNQLKEVGSNRPENKRPPPKKKCLEWAYFDEKGNIVSSSHKATSISSTEESDEDLPLSLEKTAPKSKLPRKPKPLIVPSKPPRPPRVELKQPDRPPPPIPKSSFQEDQIVHKKTTERPRPKKVKRQWNDFQLNWLRQRGLSLKSLDEKSKQQLSNDYQEFKGKKK